MTLVNLFAAISGLCAAYTIRCAVRTRRLLRRNQATCGSAMHQHQTVVTAGGYPAVLCVLPHCGDRSHPHLIVATTSGWRAMACMTKDVMQRHLNLLQLRSAFPQAFPRPTSPEEKQ